QVGERVFRPLGLGRPLGHEEPRPDEGGDAADQQQKYQGPDPQADQQTGVGAAFLLLFLLFLGPRFVEVLVLVFVLVVGHDRPALAGRGGGTVAVAPLVVGRRCRPPAFRDRGRRGRGLVPFRHHEDAAALGTLDFLPRGDGGAGPQDRLAIGASE